MTRLVAYLASVAVGGALLGAKGCYDARVVERAGFRRTTDSLRVALGRQHRVSDSLASAYRVDTVDLSKTIIRWRSVRAAPKTDSFTVQPTVRESVLVAVADSAIEQCTQTVATCGALVAAKDSVINTLKASVVVEHRRRPGFFRRTGHVLKWISVGVVAGTLLQRE